MPCVQGYTVLGCHKPSASDRMLTIDEITFNSGVPLRLCRAMRLSQQCAHLWYSRISYTDWGTRLKSKSLSAQRLYVKPQLSRDQQGPIVQTAVCANLESLPYYRNKCQDQPQNSHGCTHSERQVRAVRRGREALPLSDVVLCNGLQRIAHIRPISLHPTVPMNARCSSSSPCSCPRGWPSRPSRGCR